VLAVGSSLRGDDEAGLLVGKKLSQRRWPEKPSVHVLFGETAPENLTGEIRSHNPTHLLVIDAIDGDSANDATALLELPEAEGAIAGTSFSTHILPLTVMLRYVRQSMDCRIIVLGIPIRSARFGVRPSVQVRARTARVAEAIGQAVGG
jgi:hydrogenase 3 maturation protease